VNTKSFTDRRLDAPRSFCIFEKLSEKKNFRKLLGKLIFFTIFLVFCPLV
jgi:hypothetical protein